MNQYYKFIYKSSKKNKLITTRKKPIKNNKLYKVKWFLVTKKTIKIFKKL